MKQEQIEALEAEINSPLSEYYCVPEDLRDLREPVRRLLAERKSLIEALRDCGMAYSNDPMVGADRVREARERVRAALALAES